MLSLNAEVCRNFEVLTDEWKLDATLYDVCPYLTHPNNGYGISNDRDSSRTVFENAEEFYLSATFAGTGRLRSADDPEFQEIVDDRPATT